jgi:hypothetical protein
LSVDRFTGFIPARVIALTVRYNESMYRTLWREEVPQKMAEVMKETPMK